MIFFPSTSLQALTQLAHKTILKIQQLWVLFISLVMFVVSISSMYTFQTFISFVVRMPVLSTIRVFVLPRVSQAYKCLTTIFCLCIIFIEQAKVIPTARGNPQGMDITMMPIVTIKYQTISSRVLNLTKAPHVLGCLRQSQQYLRNMTEKMAIAEQIPVLPKNNFNFSRLISRGVSLLWLTDILQQKEFYPTARTRRWASQVELMTELPDRIKGSLVLLANNMFFQLDITYQLMMTLGAFSIYGSSYTLLASLLLKTMFQWRTKTPSAGMVWPISSSITSPTNRSLTMITSLQPFLITWADFLRLISVRIWFWILRKLVQELTTKMVITANRMEAPQTQPSSTPSVTIPRTSKITEAQVRSLIILSLLKF